MIRSRPTRRRSRAVTATRAPTPAAAAAARKRKAGLRKPIARPAVVPATRTTTEVISATAKLPLSCSPRSSVTAQVKRSLTSVIRREGEHRGRRDERMRGKRDRHGRDGEHRGDHDGLEALYAPEEGARGALGLGVEVEAEADVAHPRRREHPDEAAHRQCDGILPVLAGHQEPGEDREQDEGPDLGEEHRHQVDEGVLEPGRYADAPHRATLSLAMRRAFKGEDGCKARCTGPDDRRSGLGGGRARMRDRP